ncbi:hypothetical protein [uncultured Polaribacter sp.]|uniref:hypothetical protein n=1 Tax=uncultured Polaribacter sp. TaxID=174711 RepID=UPI0030DB7E89|tara:strand:- start:828 stop:1427 length:600 start_codon:yes stop_codon:yes gene_type:complete
MKKLKLCILIILVSSSTYAQNKHFDAMSDIVKALENLKSLSEKLNRNGWNDSYYYKSYNTTMQNVEKHLSNATDKLYESIDLIEEIENTNYKCSNDDLSKRSNDLINNLKKLKSKLNSYLRRLNNLDNSEIASRLYTIYKYPNNSRYIRVASKEVSNYLKPTFNDLKEIYNSMVTSSRDYDYFKLNVESSQSKLSQICN